MKRGSFEMFTSDTWMKVGCWGNWDVRSHGVGKFDEIASSF
jgi:hypothetical protein